MTDEGKRNNRIVSLKEQLGGESLSLVSEENIDKLYRKVQEMLKDDLVALSEIKRLCKSEETMRNSLGSIYHYLNSRKLCDGCRGSLSSCPQPLTGHCETLRYDEDRDQIVSYRMACRYQQDLQSTLGRITPCDRSRTELYQDMFSLVSALQRTDDFAQMKDTGKEFIRIRSAIASLKQGKTAVGASFFDINSISLPNALLASACFFAGKEGLKTVYLKTADFFNALRDFHTAERDWAEHDFTLALRADVLLLEDFTEYPFLPIELRKKYLFPLLKARAEKGKLTYLSLSSSLPPKTIVRRALSALDCSPEGEEMIGKIAPMVTLKDIDIR